jgi:GH35 family endo-1,4-beta-xylanase
MTERILYQNNKAFFTHYLNCTLLLCLLPVLGFAQLVAPQKLDIPSGGQVIAQSADWQQSSRLEQLKQQGYATEVDGPAWLPHEAIKVAFDERPESASKIGFELPVNESIRKGDVLLLTLWARCTLSEDESGDGRLLIRLQQNKSPYDSYGHLTAAVGKQWLHLARPIQINEDFDKQAINLSVHLGYYPQHIELAGIELINYGSKLKPEDLPRHLLSYEGREPQAPWRKEALARIEKHRKADVTVQVSDKKGRPLTNAEVELHMTAHTFAFGSATNFTALLKEDADGEQYRKTFLENFNKTTTETGFRWQNWFRGSDKAIASRKAQLMQSLQWYQQHHIPVRGHYLMWGPLEPRFQPEHLLDKPVELRQALFAHMSDKTNWSKGLVAEWDAINHIIGWGTTYADLCGKEIYVEAMKRGRELCPGQPLWVNEGQVLPSGSRIVSYKEIVQYLVEAGAAPDGIGFMAHFRESSLTPPARVYEVLDEFAQIVPALQLTEFDVEAGDDFELQGDYFRDILLTAFSHPAMKGIINWGFWEGMHWRPQAALWSENWQIKPAGEAWRKYVYGEWWSRESTQTNSNGTAEARVFNGKYQLTVRHKGEEKKFDYVIEGPQEIKVTW